MTGVQFDALPYEEGRQWELLEGDLIAVSSPTPEHQIFVQRLLLALMLHFKRHSGGIVLADVEFALSESDRVRPDVLVLLGERAANLDRFQVPVPGASDIAVEVISPSERTAESLRKVDRYLVMGVREIWQIYPKLRQVIVYTPELVRKLNQESALQTGLLPEFSLSIPELFEA